MPVADDEITERLRTIAQMLAALAYVAAARFHLECKEREFSTALDGHAEDLAGSALLTFRRIEAEIEDEEE